MKIRRMVLSDVEQVLGWAADEGWNPGLDDGTAFYKTDPTGFFVAHDGDKLIAAVSVIKYNEHNGFLGLYICHPDYRGNGIGLSVWNAGMQYLDGTSIGLDGVVEQQSNYQRSGFAFAYRNIRFRGVIDIPDISNVDVSTQGYVCRSTDKNDLAELRKFDLTIHGIDRRVFIDHWFVDTNYRKTMVCVQKGAVVGVGTMRLCSECPKIGPLFANDAGIARHLVDELANAVDARELVLDVPEPNQAAVKLAEGLGLKPVFETARMYRGTEPDYRLARLFGVSTFELG